MAPTKKIGIEKSYEVNGSATSGRQQQKLFTTTEAAMLLKISEKTLWDWMKEGKIEHVQLGSHVYLSEDVVRSILGDCGKPNPATKEAEKELDPLNKPPMRKKKK